MQLILLHPHLPSRKTVRNLLTHLGHEVIYENDIASMPKIVNDTLKLQPHFIVAEEPEPQVRQAIEQGFDKLFPDIPIVWLPNDYWEEPREKWLISELTEMASYM